MRRLLISICLLCSSYILWSQEGILWDDLPKSKLLHTITFIGDAGHLDPDNPESHLTLLALKKFLASQSKNSSVVFLGDNIYSGGFPEKENSSRPHAERVLDMQLSILEDFKGKAYMIPGNHDWSGDGVEGLDNLIRLEDYVESYFSEKDKIRFLPGKGCGSVKTKSLSKDLTMVFIDSEWWFRNNRYNPHATFDCSINTRGDYLEEIRSVLVDNRNDKLIIAMHHPMHAFGSHGGHYSIGDHIFPLSRVDKHLLIPLPVVGSFPVLIKGLYGSREDLSHPDYKELMSALLKMVNDLEIEASFVSGHEHGLLYERDGDIRYITSGTGSLAEHLASPTSLSYAKSRRGFSAIYYYEGEEMWLEIYLADIIKGEATLDYRVSLYPNNQSLLNMDTHYPSLPDSISFIEISPNASYEAGNMKKFWFGKQYRDIWSTPVNIPVINLEKVCGGLTPVKLGGGKSSNTLRLKCKDGHEYNLRSVDKYYYKTFGETYKEVKLFRIVQEMVSAHHPYAPLMSAFLSEASGIYHTSPKLYYLKHQKALKGFNDMLPEGIYWLEKRPSHNWKDDPRFGYAQDIISYHDLLEKLRTKKNHEVDQKWVLRSRLLDMLIHDWDRHNDNWRWAVFKNENKTIYRPIPRDRDMAFYKMEGIFPGIISNFVERKLLPIRDKIKDVRRLNENAGDFDRRFLNELNRDEWDALTKEFISTMTDSILMVALEKVPEEALDLNKKALSNTLLKRRDNLYDAALELYDQLAEEVVVVGMDEQDLFTIVVDAHGNVNVSQHILSKKDHLILKYQRKFLPAETRRIIIYGLSGDDRFNVIGSGSSKIDLLLLGGSGDDQYINSSNSIRPKIYDYMSNFQVDGAFDHNITGDVGVNEYHAEGYQYDRYYHLAEVGINRDDGFWFGYGQMRNYEAWPYTEKVSKHTYSVAIAPSSAKFLHLEYAGKFNNLLGKNIHVLPIGQYKMPTYVNYFGLGNNSTNTAKERSFNWVRMHEVLIGADIEKSINYDKIRLRGGPYYLSNKVINKENRITDDEYWGFTEEAFDRRHFLGLQSEINLGFKDHPRNPTSGFGLNLGGSYGFQPGKQLSTTSFFVNTHFYIPLIRGPDVVLAQDIGLEYIWGEPEFFQYPPLGQNNHLRGFRKNRFRGDRLFYHNLDLRVHLVDWFNVYLPMNIGLIGGFDYGRVWLEEEVSDKYYSSWSVGLSLDIMYLFTLHPYVSFTDEGMVFSMMSGLKF